MKAELISPYLFAGMQPWHRNNYLKHKQTFEFDVEKILNTVCQQFGVSVTDILGRNRDRVIAAPRQVAMYFLRKYTHRKLSQIGVIFGRDHSTVVYGIQVVKDLCDTDAQFSQLVSDIENKIVSLP